MANDDEATKPTVPDLGQGGGLILDMLRKREEQGATILAELKSLSVQVRDTRAEGQQRGAEQSDFNRRVDRELHQLRNELRATNTNHAALASRVTTNEISIQSAKDIATHAHDQAAEGMQHASNHDWSTQAAIGAAVSHVRTVDHAIIEIKDTLSEQAEKLENQIRVDKAFSKVLGIDYAAVSMPPPEAATPTEAIELAEKREAAEAPKANLPKVSRTMDRTLVVGVVAAAASLFQLLQAVLERLSHH